MRWFAFFIFVSRENSFSTFCDTHGFTCTGCTGWMHRHITHFFHIGIPIGSLQMGFSIVHQLLTVKTCKVRCLLVANGREKKSLVRINWSMALQFVGYSSFFASFEIVRASNRHTEIRSLPSSSAPLLLWPLSVLKCFICGHYHK